MADLTQHIRHERAVTEDTDRGDLEGRSTIGRLKRDEETETKSAKQDWEGRGRIAHASRFKSPS